jgi:hypothetical protein
VVPLYRVICEPLRASLLYACLLQALKGKPVGWYQPARTNTVPDLTARQDRTARGADLTRETAGVGIRSPPHSPRKFLLIITGLVSQYGRRSECSFAPILAPAHVCGTLGGLSYSEMHTLLFAAAIG